MKNNTILWLARHTTPDIDLKICYGQTDVDVKASFADEAKLLNNKLKYIDIEEIYSSPLQRCVKLAQSIQQSKKSSLKTHNLLKEMNFGEWEQMAWADIPRSDIDNWATDPFGFRPPMGESFTDLIERASAFYKTEQPSTNQLIVTHAGIIRAYLVLLLNMDPHEALKFDLPFACLCKIDVHEKTIQLID